MISGPNYESLWRYAHLHIKQTENHDWTQSKAGGFDDHGQAAKGRDARSELTIDGPLMSSLVFVMSKIKYSYSILL